MLPAVEKRPAAPPSIPLALAVTQGMCITTKIKAEERNRPPSANTAARQLKLASAAVSAMTPAHRLAAAQLKSAAAGWKLQKRRSKLTAGARGQEVACARALREVRSTHISHASRMRGHDTYDT